jgi:hypothetical protein
MAVNYASPDERVKARKKVLSDFINVAQPAQQEQAQQEQQGLKRQVLSQTAALGTQSPQLQGLGSLGILQTAQGQGAQMLGNQAAAQDKLNLQGAGMQQDIAGARSQQALTNTEAGAASSQEKLARAVANKAFASGMEAKQLLLHENSSLADYSLQQLSKDFEAGRTSQKDLQALQIQLKQSALQKQYAADEELQRALKEFQWALQRGNTEREKQRILRAFEAQKSAMKDAARASGIASIISGVFGAIGSALS